MNDLRARLLDRTFDLLVSVLKRFYFEILYCRSLSRSFRPDFVLIRQSVRGIGPKEDYRNILLGLQFGNVPCVNSLTSIYNFAEKPWVVSYK